MPKNSPPSHLHPLPFQIPPVNALCFFGRTQGRTIRYLEGGGLEFLLLGNFFFNSERKQSFFLSINFRQIFFHVSCYIILFTFSFVDLSFFSGYVIYCIRWCFYLFFYCLIYVFFGQFLFLGTNFFVIRKLSPPSEEVGTCWFTSVRPVCACHSFLSVCPACNSVAKRSYVLTCKSSIYFLFAGVTAHSLACHSPSKRRYKHTCEKSRYFHFAVSSSACHSPSKRR